jgi:UDP-N-acetylglucosamine--N-acetylmuramyl-(pentapeptide) pyrophosphoryl-undecaprenol N-acetylglucosamine transferase
MRIVIATGGTGGHIFPALSLLEEIKHKQYQYIVVADRRILNFSKSIPQDTQIKIIESEGFSRGMFKKIAAILKNLLGTLQALKLFLKFKPNIVVSFGGYPAFPSMLAAKLMRIPLLIQEPNSVVGQANKIFVHSATAIACAFKNTKGIKNGKHIHVTGTPVRKSIIATRQKRYPSLNAKSKIKLLIIGGSQGAHILSKILPSAIVALSSELRDRLEIVQQCRPEDIVAVRNIYKKNKVNVCVDSFFVDMHHKLEDAHLVICRAGATTIAELTAVGRPAIFIPISASKENHQFLNAEWFVKQEAGWLIQEKDFSVAYCTQQLDQILKDHKKIELFAQHARDLFLDSSNILLKLIEKYCTKP